MSRKLGTAILNYGKMVKFSHTVFAMPFALSAMIMAWRDHPFKGADLLFILLAMVGARSAAMGFNRIADAEIDGRNPRTALREIPSGILGTNEAAVFTGMASLLFIFSAAMLGTLCLVLSFPVLGFLFFYSFTKRFTKYSHVFLGLAIGLAPAGAWIGVTGSFSAAALFLALALVTYITGFDILYACQDIDFDREAGLFSIPAALGVTKALGISALFHIFTLLFLFFMQVVFGMHPLFYIFLGIIAALLVAEHLMVRPGNLDRINIAFFHMNSLVSIVLVTGVACEALFR